MSERDTAGGRVGALTVSLWSWQPAPSIVSLDRAPQLMMVPMIVAPEPDACAASKHDRDPQSSADATGDHALGRPWGRFSKRSVDLLVGGLLLLLVAPLLALVAWRVARDGRPILYRHQRIGRAGRPFICFKFRTMATDAERLLAEHLKQSPEAAAEWRRRHKLREDPRITPFGAWLRRTSLDELPQLFNVLRGEMSLVGPRPVVAEELARYGPDVAWYLHTAPGLTGLWQVSGRNDLDYRRRIHLDCWYVRNWSLWRDLAILLKTPLAVARGRGAY